MFCKKCGKELPDGAVFCGDCGAEVNAAAPVAADAPEDTFITLNTQGQVPAGGKKKWLIPALVSGGIALVALVVAAIFLWPSPKEPVKDVEKTPVEENADINKDDIEGMFDSVGNALDSWFNGDGGNVGYEGEVRLVLSEELLSMISPGADIQWLSDIAVTYDLSSVDDLSKVALGLDLGTTEILSAEYIMDKENLEMWMLIPILSKQALFVDMNAAMQDAEASTGLIAGTTYGMLPSWDSLSDILMTYVDMFLNGFSEVKEEEETVNIEEIEQKLTVLKAEMTEKQFYQVMKDILEHIKNDKDLEELIRSSATSSDVAYDPYEDFIASIDEALTSLEETMEESDYTDNGVLYLYTYLDGNENIVGRKLGFEADEESDDESAVGISYLTVVDDTEFGFELILADNIRLAGSGDKDDHMDATFILYVEEEEFAKVEVIDYAYDAEFSTGTIRFTPLDAMMNALYESLELDAGTQMIMGMMKFVLEINISGTVQDNLTSVCLRAAEMDFVTIEISGKVAQPDEIEIPKDVVDAQNEEEMANWMQNLDQEAFMDTLLRRLEEAGVPEDLLLALGYSGGEVPL